jgi:hypothetical protein
MEEGLEQRRFITSLSNLAVDCSLDRFDGLAQMAEYRQPSLLEGLAPRSRKERGPSRQPVKRATQG